MKHTYQSVRAAYRDGQNIFRRPSVEALMIQNRSIDDINRQAELERIAAEKERDALRLRVAAPKQVAP